MKMHIQHQSGLTKTHSSNWRTHSIHSVVEREYPRFCSKNLAAGQCSSHQVLPNTSTAVLEFSGLNVILVKQNKNINIPHGEAHSWTRAQNQMTSRQRAQRKEASLREADSSGYLREQVWTFKWHQSIIRDLLWVSQTISCGLLLK